MMPFDMEMNEYDERPQTMAGLLDLQARLAVEMNDAINRGDSGAMIRIDAQSRSLEPQLFAAKVSELSESLETMAQRKAELMKEIDALREIKGHRVEKWRRAMSLVEKRGLAVGRAALSIEIAETELENLRVGSREQRDKLEKLKLSKLKEREEINARFRKIFHETGN